MTKLLRFFQPSHQHTAFSATLLLISAVMLSRVIGYARDAYIAWSYGAGGQTDAYVAAFTLPDFLNYIVAGGAASITFISIYTRFLAEKRDDDAQKTFSIIITVMTAVMIVGTILAEIFTPQFVGWFVKGFSPDKIELCVHLTRILLPAQIFFYVGGVVSAVLLSHRLFLFPAFGPLIYNVFIILGGVIGGKHFGIASLAYGALIGSFAGPFLASVIGAARIGTGYRPSFDVMNPAFREWVKLSVPLMLGVSLVAADDWILRHYASNGVGDITRLTFAKRLFAVPIAVLGQATGQASLPFFARLFNEKKRKEFAATVNDSVYRVGAASLLASGWMMVVGLPLIDLVYRRGKFLFADAQTSAIYFFWFSLSLAFWSAQGLYARAFYAAGDTLTPMAAVSVITVASLPVYSFLFHTFGVVGLAWASDIGIGVNLVALAGLLHYRKLVPLNELRWWELGKAAVVAAVAGGISFEVAKVVPLAISGRGSREVDLTQLAVVSITWAAAVAGGLWLLRSELPRDLRRRQGAVYPEVAQVAAKEIPMTTAVNSVSIQTLVEALRQFPESAFDHTESIRRLLQDTPVSADSLAPYLTWNRQHYTRNLIDRTPLYELMAICWEVGQASSVHNHRDQNCWMAVPIGRLQVENFHLIHQDLQAGRCRLEASNTVEMNISQPCAVDPADPVHRVVNPREFNARAVSLHVYSRPFDTCVVYSPEQGTCGEIELHFNTEYGKPK